MDESKKTYYLELNGSKAYSITTVTSKHFRVEARM